MAKKKRKTKRDKPNPLRADPTRTGTLRTSMQRDLRERLARLQREGARRVTEARRKLAAFPTYWTRYTEEAVTKGVERSWSDARRQLPKEEFDVLRRDFVRRMDAEISGRANLAAERVGDELENVATDLVTRVRRTLRDADVQGLNQRETAKLVREQYGIAERRAAMIVRTETTRAHADGQLAALEELGVKNVSVEVEWRTTGLPAGVTAAGNPSPCPQCAPMEGRRFTLREARGLIPLHPNCRCVFVPALESKKGRKKPGRVTEPARPKRRLKKKAKRREPSRPLTPDEFQSFLDRQRTAAERKAKKRRRQPVEDALRRYRAEEARRKKAGERVASGLSPAKAAREAERERGRR